MEIKFMQGGQGDGTYKHFSIEMDLQFAKRIVMEHLFTRWNEHSRCTMQNPEENSFDWFLGDCFALWFPEDVDQEQRLIHLDNLRFWFYADRENNYLLLDDNGEVTLYRYNEWCEHHQKGFVKVDEYYQVILRNRMERYWNQNNTIPAEIGRYCKWVIQKLNRVDPLRYPWNNEKVIYHDTNNYQQ